MAVEVDTNCCYLCNQCASSFASLEDLEAHMSTHNADDVTETEGEEGGERRRAHEENSPSSSDGSFPMEPSEGIEGMEQETVDPGGDEDNINLDDSSSKTLIYPCRFCSKLFQSRSLLNIHYTHTHRDKPQYECEDCGRIFSVKRELATHRRIHAGEATHACAQCGKEFGTRQLLKKHWMWHTGQRSHVCPHCGKAFFQKGHLTQHLMIHAGGRPHVCQLCNKTFIFKFDLNRHMKIHAERGYSCTKCGRAFLKEATLVDHLPKCQGPDGSTKKQSPRARSRPQSTESARNGSKTPSSPSNTSPLIPPSPAKSDNQLRNRSPIISPSPNNTIFPPMSSPITTPGQPQRFVCLLCMQDFPSQAAYSLHLSYVHFRDGVFNPYAQQQQGTIPNGNKNTPPPLCNPTSVLMSAAASQLMESLSGSGSLGTAGNAARIGDLLSSAGNLPPSSASKSDKTLNGHSKSSTFGSSSPFDDINNMFNRGANSSLLNNNIPAMQNVSYDQKSPLTSLTDNGATNRDRLQAFISNGVNTSMNPPASSEGRGSRASGRKSATDSQSPSGDSEPRNLFVQPNSAAGIKQERESVDEDSTMESNNNNSIDETGQNGLTSASDITPNLEFSPECVNCQNTQGQVLGVLRRVGELERAVANRDSEIDRLRGKMRRVGMVAGSLLESCSEFDKLWMLHSKKVYSQIQSVLNSLD